MLKNPLFSNNFLRFFKSGLNIDFIFKKIIEGFIRNFLVYGAQFFAEKYIIEYFTKKCILSTNTILSSLYNYKKNLGTFDIIYTFVNFIFVVIFVVIFVY